MKDLVQVAQERFQRLRFGPSPCVCARCRRPKDPICGGRFDVDSFFGNCDVARVLQSVESLVRRIALLTGKETVTVSLRSGGRCWLGGNLRGHAQDTEVLAFHELVDISKFECGHRWYMLGDVVLEIAKGLPTGGSLSEVLAAVYMASCTRRLYCDRRYCEEVGLHVDGFTLDQTVASLLHVDDMMILSGLLCLKCLSYSLAALLHPLSASLEESLPQARFLDSQWKVTGMSLQISCHNHNFEFAVGDAMSQKVVRVIPFLAYDFVPQFVLHCYIQSRVARIRQLCALPVDELMALYEMTSELLNLGFPSKMVRKSLARTPPSRNSKVLNSFRKMLRLL